MLQWNAVAGSYRHQQMSQLKFNAKRDTEKRGERSVNVTSFGDSDSLDQLLKKHFLIASGNHIYFSSYRKFSSRPHCDEY